MEFHAAFAELRVQLVQNGRRLKLKSNAGPMRACRGAPVRKARVLMDVIDFPSGERQSRPGEVCESFSSAPKLEAQLFGVELNRSLNVLHEDAHIGYWVYASQ